MKTALLTTLAALAFAAPSFAEIEAGDAAAGEKEFNKCKACHTITDDSGEAIVRGGKVGPNLYNIIGRAPASVEDFKYGDGILKAAEVNPDLVWTQEEIIAYVTEPKAWLDDKVGEPGQKTKMTFKLTKGQADIAAYLLSVSPDAPTEDEAAAEGEAATEAEAKTE